jgi:SAM-dependent methyltransferase
MHSSRHVSADLGAFFIKRIDVKMSIVDLPFADDRFDVVLCSHVLEHIEDDRRALSEIHRVMKPHGWAILQTPMDCWRETSLEDPTIDTPELRRKHYWQADHVRLYGRDILQRFSSAGFLPELVPPDLICDDLETRGLEPWEDLMLVRKL